MECAALTVFFKPVSFFFYYTMQLLFQVTNTYRPSLLTTKLQLNSKKKNL